MKTLFLLLVLFSFSEAKAVTTVVSLDDAAQLQFVSPVCGKTATIEIDITAISTKEAKQGNPLNKSGWTRGAGRKACQAATEDCKKNKTDAIAALQAIQTKWSTKCIAETCSAYTNPINSTASCDAGTLISVGNENGAVCSYDVSTSNNTTTVHFPPVQDDECLYPTSSGGYKSHECTVPKTGTNSAVSVKLDCNPSGPPVPLSEYLFDEEPDTGDEDGE